MQLISKQDIKHKLNENHYSKATIGVYLSWIGRFIKYHGIEFKQYNIQHIPEYLASLESKNLKFSTYNQSINAIAFFYNKILRLPVNKPFIASLRLPHSAKLPDTLTKDQINSIVYHLKGYYQLLVYLLYGCGLRSSEVLNLKVKDIDQVNNQLTVSNDKYFRVLPIPIKIHGQLKKQLAFVAEIHNKDITNKFFHGDQFENCYLFPMKQLCSNSEGRLIRLPIISNTLNYNIMAATNKANIPFKVTAQTFRHSYAVRLLQNQIDLKTVQKLLSHKNASSTLIYTHIAQNISQKKCLSPLDLE